MAWPAAWYSAGAENKSRLSKVPVLCETLWVVVGFPDWGRLKVFVNDSLPWFNKSRIEMFWPRLGLSPALCDWPVKVSDILACTMDYHPDEGEDQPPISYSCESAALELEGESQCKPFFRHALHGRPPSHRDFIVIH